MIPKLTQKGYLKNFIHKGVNYISIDDRFFSFGPFKKICTNAQQLSLMTYHIFEELYLLNI